jgi:hypothetical protein
MSLSSALTWVNDLQLFDMNFEMDCKRLVNNLYSKNTYAFELGAIINDHRHLISINLANSHVKFIKRQANEITHSFARMAPQLLSFHILIDIFACIHTIFMNEMR